MRGWGGLYLLWKYVCALICCTSLCHHDRQEGETVLMAAAAEGHADFVSIIVANGAGVNMASKVVE